MQKLTLSVFFRPIIVLLLAAFAGCVTHKIEYVDSDKLPKKKVYHITQAFMRNGTVIDLKDKEPVFKLYHKGISNVILYYEDVNIESTILLKDVQSFKIDIVESNQVLTVIIILVTIPLLFITAILIALGTGGWSMH